MSLTVKAFLQKSGSRDEEIRRFSIPADVSSSYEYLCRKISDVFPSLRHGRFILYWKDSDGDQVAFSRDEELLEALGFVKDSLLKIYVREKGSSDSSKDAELHPGVVCDGCDGAIVGNRYKCMACPDYDLCCSCEKKGIHKEHDMMRITTPMETGYCVPPPAGYPPHMGFPFGPHRSGPQGPFFPPPHFRRWMHKFMKRWHNRNGPGCAAENETEEAKMQKEEKPEKPETEEQDEDRENVEEDYLKTVGESVAAMLDPFGIDVSVDVEHDGRRHRCSKGDKRGHAGNGSCPERGHNGHGKGAGCPWKRKGEKDNKNEEPSVTEPESFASVEKSKDDGTKSMETELIREPEKQPASPMMTDAQYSEPTPSSSPKDDGWTMLSITQAVSNRDTEVPSPAISEETCVPYLHPDPKISEALHQMLAMGFNNDGGWLTNLLVSVNGDIGRALDAMKPNAVSTGRSRHTLDGNMA
ncbi:hypothetical protein CHS0354_042914 [Potamilus streckersoni]|uniref:Protein ref(2)P n=1 Tax=Potamilus streckersoni TaxID=2493646 RepID=A0AAE0T5K5_9BIVA|nr:hypothetical protein CHS0354_042914 [Potamilus streckersoni]